MRYNNKKILIIIPVLAVLISVFCLFTFAAEENENLNGEEEVTIPVVYVNDAGSDNNDGLTPKASFATIKKAYSALSETGGRIIICGKLTLDDNDPTFPAHDKDIEITSLDQGVDYRNKNKAEIQFYDTINIHGPAKTTFNGVKFHSKQSAGIYCYGSNVVFDTRVDNVSDDDTYPSIYGGRQLDVHSSVSDGNFSDFTIEVNSGYWHHVTLGNLRSDKNSPMSTIKNGSLIINGGTFISTDNNDYTTSLVSGAYVSGKCDLTITAGIFYGSLYAIGNEGPLPYYSNQRYSADISVNISNGSFLGNYIKALYNENATLHGSYDFKASDGSFSSLIYVSCEGVYGSVSLDSCDSIESKLYGFQKVAYVSSKGDDKNSGENPDSPKKTLSGAITSLVYGGTVVIIDEIKLPREFTLTNNTNKITVTSKHSENDYAQTNNAKITLEGDIRINTDYVFRDIVFSAVTSSNIVSYGSHLEFSDNVNVNGDVGIKLAQTETDHTLKLSSGVFTSVEFSNSPILTRIIINGASVNAIKGSNTTHKGDLYIELSSGSIKEDVDLSTLIIEGNVQLICSDIVTNGSIVSPSVTENKVSEALITNPEHVSRISGFALINDNYIFVKDNGTGNGLTPSSALPSIEDAINVLGDKNAVIVICGKYTHDNNNTSLRSGIHTYTSNYRGIDLSLYDNARLILKSDFYFYNDATIKDITINTDAPNIAFRCDSHIVIFGYGINCVPALHTNEFYPSIFAAETTPLAPFNDKGQSVSDKITIMGGSWYNVYGSAATHINGSVIRGSVIGTDTLNNDCVITVSNGVIRGGVYAASRVRENCKNDISITFTGGEIHGYISPSKEGSSGYLGKYVINISGGDFSGVEIIRDASYIGGENSYAYITNDYEESLYNSKVIKYQNPITVNYANLYYLDGYWYLFERNDQIIEIYRSISLQSLKTSTAYHTIDTGSHIYELSVNLTNNKFYIFAKNTFNSAVRSRVYTSNKNGTAVTFDFLKDIEDDSICYPSLLWLNGELFMYYSMLSEEGTMDIYCVKLKDDLSYATDPRRVLSADQKWEAGHITTPKILVASDGNIFLFYTGGEINSGSSMIGISLLTKRNDLLNEASYIKDKDPAFYESETYKNLVISSFICIKDSEPYIVYSARKDKESMLLMQSFTYDDIGKPYINSECDLGMLYLSYHNYDSINGKLAAFKINYKEELPPSTIIGQPSLLIDLSITQIIIIIVIIAVVLIVTALIVFVKKNENKNAGYDKKTKKRARKRSGQLYVEYLNSKSVDESAVTDSLATEVPSEELSTSNNETNEKDISSVNGNLVLRGKEEDTDNIENTNTTEVTEKQEEENSDQSSGGRRRPRPARRI